MFFVFSAHGKHNVTPHAGQNLTAVKDTLFLQFLHCVIFFSFFITCNMGNTSLFYVFYIKLLIKLVKTINSFNIFEYCLSFFTIYVIIIT